MSSCAQVSRHPVRVSLFSRAHESGSCAQVSRFHLREFPCLVVQNLSVSGCVFADIRHVLSGLCNEPALCLASICSHRCCCQFAFVFVCKTNSKRSQVLPIQTWATHARLHQMERNATIMFGTSQARLDIDRCMMYMDLSFYIVHVLFDIYLILLKGCLTYILRSLKYFLTYILIWIK